MFEFKSLHFSKSFIIRKSEIRAKAAFMYKLTLAEISRGRTPLTRNPSNLLQSWMHYAEKRANEIILNLSTTGDINQCSGNDLSMLVKVHPLKQNTVKVDLHPSGNINAIYLSSNLSLIALNAEEEEYNLLRFADHLRHTVPDGIYQLTSMSTQLFSPYLEKIEKKFREGKPVSVTPPTSSGARKIVYYDCENISQRHQMLLDQAICPNFSERLLQTRRNTSQKKSKKPNKKHYI